MTGHMRGDARKRTLPEPKSVEDYAACLVEPMTIGEVINLESQRAQPAESKTCPQCGGVWWQNSVVISAETEKVTAYAAPLRCLGCVDHVPKIGGVLTFDELHAAPRVALTPETPDPESERWECGPHSNAWGGHDARCRKVRDAGGEG